MSTTTLEEVTIEELKAAIVLKEEALREEKRAIVEKERQERQRIEDEARAVAEAKHRLVWETAAKAIIEELKIVGFSAASYIIGDNGKYPKITCIPGDSYPAWIVSFEEVWEGGHHSARTTKIKVGQYGSGHTYPQLKAGGFNYKKIAATAWELYQDALVKQKRANTEKNNEESNKARISRLTNTFGELAYKGADYKNIPNVKINYYTFHNGGNRGGHHASYTYRSDNDLMLDITHISEEDAEKVLRFMKENGMLEKK